MAKPSIKAVIRDVYCGRSADDPISPTYVELHKLSTRMATRRLMNVHSKK